MMSNLNSNMTSQFPLAIPTRSKGPQARLVLRGENGVVIKQWLIKQSKCTLGSDPECAIRCDLPGIAAHHVLIVVGLRQTFLRSLAPKLTRDGVTVNELLLSGDSNSFEVAGHQFELTRQDSAGQLPSVEGASTRMRFAVSRPLETQASNAQASSPTVVAKGEHADLLPAGADAATPRWVARIVRDAILPLEDQLREVMQPIANLQTEVRREKKRRLAEEQRRERLQGETAEQPKLDAAAVEAEVKQQVSVIAARQSSSLDVITERISDVNQQLSSIERIVASEQDAPPPPMDPQIAAEIEAQSSSVQKLQEGFVAVAGALSALQDSQRETAESDVQWKSEIQGKLEALQNAVESMHTRSLESVEELSNEQLYQYAEQLDICQSTFAVIAPTADEFSHEGVAAQSVAEEWDISTLVDEKPAHQPVSGMPQPIAENLPESLGTTPCGDSNPYESLQTSTPEYSTALEPVDFATDYESISPTPQAAPDDFDHDWDHSVNITPVEHDDSEEIQVSAQPEPVDFCGEEDDEFPVVPQALNLADSPAAQDSSTDANADLTDDLQHSAARLFPQASQSPLEDTAEKQQDQEADGLLENAGNDDLRVHDVETTPDAAIGVHAVKDAIPPQNETSSADEAGEAASLPSWWNEHSNDSPASDRNLPAQSSGTGFTEQEFAAVSPWDLDTASWPEGSVQNQLDEPAAAPDPVQPSIAEPFALDLPAAPIETGPAADQDIDESALEEVIDLQQPSFNGSGDRDSNDSTFELLDNLNAAISDDAASDDEPAHVDDAASDSAAEQVLPQAFDEGDAEEEFETALGNTESSDANQADGLHEEPFPTMNLMSEVFGDKHEEASAGNSADNELGQLEASFADLRQHASVETVGTSRDSTQIMNAADTQEGSEEPAVSEFPTADWQQIEIPEIETAADIAAEEPFIESTQAVAEKASVDTAGDEINLPTNVAEHNPSDMEQRIAGDSTEEGEDASVEDYMRRLLARMRGEEEPEDEGPAASGNPELAIDIPSQIIQDAAENSHSASPQPPGESQTATRLLASNTDSSAGLLGDSQSPLASDNDGGDGLTQAQFEMLAQKEEEARVLRRQQSQNPDQIAAMRELANSTARTAIVKSNQRRVLSSLLLKAGIALVGIVVGIALIAINGFDLNIGLIATIAALLVGAIWGWDAFTSLKHFRQSPPKVAETSDDAESPLQEAIASPNAEPAHDSDA